MHHRGLSRMARFTDRLIKGLKPKEQRYEVRGERGFAIWVGANGTKTWVFIYTFKGKKRRVTLGTYPGMTLKDAGEAVKKMRECLERGVDPVEWRQEQERTAEDAKRKADEEARREAGTPTVADLVEDYLNKWAKPRKRSWREDERILMKDVVPRWGGRKARDITRRDIIALLDDILGRGSPIMANSTWAVVRKMFTFGVGRGILDTTPCVAIETPAKKQACDHILSDDDILLFWTGLVKTDISEHIQLALKLQLTTGQRKGEVISAEWEEFDLPGGWWTIPGPKAKNGLPHEVPLTGKALDLLERIQAISQGSRWLFPSSRTANHILQTSVDHAVKRHINEIGVHSFTPHDLRRTAATGIAALRFPRLVVSKVLNHVDGSVTGIYDRHRYRAEKRAALEAWGRRLEEIIAGRTDSNVVEFARRGSE